MRIRGRGQRGGPYSRAETRGYRVARSRTLGVHNRWSLLPHYPHYFGKMRRRCPRADERLVSPARQRSIRVVSSST